MEPYIFVIFQGGSAPPVPHPPPPPSGSAHEKCGRGRAYLAFVPCKPGEDKLTVLKVSRPRLVNWQTLETDRPQQYIQSFIYRKIIHNHKIWRTEVYTIYH